MTSIRLSQIQKKIEEAYHKGYGNTVELKINGEHYTIYNDIREKNQSNLAIA